MLLVGQTYRYQYHQDVLKMEWQQHLVEIHHHRNMILSMWCYDDVLTDNLIKDVSYCVRCISIITTKTNKIILYNAAGSREAIKRMMQNFSNCPSVILLNFFMRMSILILTLLKTLLVPTNRLPFSGLIPATISGAPSILTERCALVENQSKTDKSPVRWNLQGAQDVFFIPV